MLSGMAEEHIAKRVDHLLAQPKSLEGLPSWHPPNQQGEARMLMPLAIGRQLTDAILEINGYPMQRNLRFRIMIRLGECVCRLDYVEDEPHMNPLDTWKDCGGQFTAPHMHHWQDNRRYCRQSDLPERLPVARLLPGNIRQFDAAFRWFCDKTNIAQPPAGMIELPPWRRLP